MVPFSDQLQKFRQGLRVGGHPVAPHGLGAFLFDSFELVAVETCAFLRFLQGGGGVVGVAERAAVLFRMSPMPAMANRSLSQFSTDVPLRRARSFFETRAQKLSARPVLPYDSLGASPNLSTRCLRRSIMSSALCKSS